MHSSSGRLRSSLPRRLRWCAVFLIIGLIALLNVQPAHMRAVGLQDDVAAANLDDTELAAAPTAIGPGEQATFTLTLRNSGNSATTANVVIAMPDELNVVGGSVTGGGSYDSGARVLSWNGVDVGANAAVPLAFKVTARGSIGSATSVVVKAAVQSPVGQFLRVAQVTLEPSGSGPAPSNLAGSDKTASRPNFATGEELGYTITVRNSSDSAVVVAVSDPLPSQLDVVSGSITGGGVYNAATRTITWANVNVGANAAVPLAFRVKANVYVNFPAQITNTATITANGGSFTRSATVLLTSVPIDAPPTTGPKLGGSYKSASQSVLGNNEQVTYTIRLINSGNEAATVDVRDPIPADLSYVAGSATGGGAYDANTRTITWDNVAVPAASDKTLTFVAKPAGTISAPKSVINVATITSGDQTLERRARITLSSSAAPGDVRPPQVQSVTIGTQDVLTSRSTTLRIQASDDQELRWMFVQEWQLDATPAPRWTEVRNSGWIPYQAQLPWTLGAENGTHFVGVYVADDANNVSRLDRQALDFASLVQPNNAVSQAGLVPYLVGYGAGVNVSAAVKPDAGDADLYAWYPGNFGLPDKQSTQDGTATDTVSFTTPRAGVYLFVVAGKSASTYDLSITPGGGPRAETFGMAEAQSAAEPDASAAAVTESLLARSGVDPLAVAVQPNAPNTLFLPQISR